MSLLIDNLISPVVLCFLLGVVARLVNSDLTIPEPVQQGLSIYLLLAIGLKGGSALAVTPVDAILMPGLVTLLIGVVTPIIAWVVMRRFARLGRVDASAVAAHYGSVSVVTFLAAGETVRRAGFDPEGFLPALVALLEVPGIVVALLFAGTGGSWKKALHEVMTGKSIVLLAGGLVIGALCGPDRLAGVNPFFGAAFMGALCLFMIDLGVAAGRRLRDARSAGARLLLAGCLLPLVNGSLGVVLGVVLAGMSVGGAAILGAMAASASYIAAPAAVRIALPKANPAYYLTLALGVTFPFNLALGIPLFMKLSQTLHTWLP